ncbi:uncharacterized protein LOC108097066 [Drosophila ficusphila]|uniref:uncharacterized protein LOC108097066 n=1 Tax=Drosophila ficusphila TaxID=30025 RepID=UPI001C897467|nr:uncharacterized protein LOC108097066 [Drosophila ficusphila]
MLGAAGLLLLVAFATLLVWDYFWRKRRNDMLHYMPGPRPLPLLGNLLMYRGLNAEQIMDFVAKNQRKYGRLYRVWVIHQLAVFSTDPRDIEFVLSSQQHITKNNLYKLLHGWLGEGLLMSTGRKWHGRRKIITPAFHFTILEQFVEIFDQQSAVMVEQLLPKADGQTPLNIFPVVCLTALDIIAETAMGSKINAQMNPNLPYVQAVNDVTNIMIHRFINAWQRVDWIFRLTKPAEAKRQDAAIKVMHDFTESIIRERRQALVSSSQDRAAEQVEQVDDLGQKRRMALLDVLLQSTIDGAPLSDEDIREEVDTFMFEGHDTTTSAISFCLYEISRHPEVQQRLLQEILEVLGEDRKRPVTLRDLGNLKYLENVIKESLRLHPPVPMIGRWFSEDVEIRGQRIPAGTNFTLGIYVLLRDPEYFENPDEFRPDRFDADVPQTHPYAYIPFSAGPRNCIGQKFALLEMKSTISKMLRHFELLPLGPDPRHSMNIVLRSANGVHLGLKPRAVCGASDKIAGCSRAPQFSTSRRRGYNMLVALLATFLVARLVAWLFRLALKELRHPLRSVVPSVSRIPLVGSAWQMRSFRPDNLHEKFAEYVQRFGRSFMGSVMGHVIVVTAEPRHLDALLHSPQQLRKGTMYLALRGWLGNGLLLSRGEEWHTMRKIITPTFHFSILEQFVEVFDRQSSRLVERLQPLSRGQQAVDIYPYVGLAALDIITETAMGVSVRAQGDEDSEVVHAVKDLTNILATRFMRPHLLFPQLFRLCWPSGFKKQQAGVQCLHQFTNRIIEQRRSLLAREVHADQPEKRHALLDTLLRATLDGQPLTDKQIRDEVNTFIFEGHDTTTSAVSFCLYMLSRHEAVQQRLLDELRKHYGQDLERGVVLADFAALPYLNCVVKESLRLFPPIPAVARCLEKDLAIDGGLIPAGTNVVILLWQLLRDEALFSDPLLFQPERHLGEESSRLGAYSYIPFSAGPRNCIGQKFALLEMKTMVIKLMRHFQLLPMGADVEPSIKIVLRSRSGVNLALRPRLC